MSEKSQPDKKILTPAQTYSHTTCWPMKKKEHEGLGYESDHEYVTDSTLFPRCEYHSRFQGTTCFAMTKPEHWGTYHRSTPGGGGTGRYTQRSIAQKTYENKLLNVPKPLEDKNTKKNEKTKKVFAYHSKTGTFHNPYKFEDYKDNIIGNKELKDFMRVDIDNEKLLYDTILQYKQKMCKVAVEAYGTDQNIIYYNNEYPCLMLSLMPFLNRCKDLSRTTTKTIRNVEHWNKILIAYYVAIVNVSAYREGIPIELVIRSSFGHNLPTIDVTGETIRVNIGTIPQQYAEILGKSVTTLIAVIEKLSTCRCDDKEFLEKKNREIEEYNENKKKQKQEKQQIKKEMNNAKEGKCRKDIIVSKWAENSTYFDILNLVGDFKGNLIVLQITRQRYYVDLLVNYVLEEYKTPRIDDMDYSRPLKKMLNLMEFKIKGITMSVDKKIDTVEMLWKDDNNHKLQEDKEFWDHIKLIASGLNVTDELAKRNNKVKGLYKFLERANKNFIVSVGGIETCSGPGSDSNADNDTQLIYAKKITVSTGIMAINLANGIGRKYIKSETDFEKHKSKADHMYYETETLLELGSQDESFSERAAIAQKEGTLLCNLTFFDLNHCNAEGKKKEISFKDYISHIGEIPPVVVLDYASATTKRIADAVNLAFSMGIKLILLVSSGLKNEQGGADDNPYGTLRIITKDKELRDKVYNLACDILKGNKTCGWSEFSPSNIFPSTAHKIRKAYKARGFVPKNEDIVKLLAESISKTDIPNQDTTKLEADLQNQFQEMNLLKSNQLEKARSEKINTPNFYQPDQSNKSTESSLEQERGATWAAIMHDLGFELSLKQLYNPEIYEILQDAENQITKTEGTIEKLKQFLPQENSIQENYFKIPEGWEEIKIDAYNYDCLLRSILTAAKGNEWAWSPSPKKTGAVKTSQQVRNYLDEALRDLMDSDDFQRKHEAEWAMFYHFWARAQQNTRLGDDLLASYMNQIGPKLNEDINTFRASSDCEDTLRKMSQTQEGRKWLHEYIRKAIFLHERPEQQSVQDAGQLLAQIFCVHIFVHRADNFNSPYGEHGENYKFGNEGWKKIHLLHDDFGMKQDENDGAGFGHYTLLIEKKS